MAVVGNAAASALRAAGRSSKVPVWVILGPPGSGKGTYAKLLAPRFGLEHLSTGDLAREAAQQPSRADLRSMLEAGQLLPDTVVAALLAERLAEVPATTSAVLLDGFPRTLSQAQLLEEHLPVALALSVALQDKHILSKIAGRRVCDSCGRTFNVADVQDEENGVFMPPILPRSAGPAACPVSAAPGHELRCDCGGQLSLRTDDGPKVAEARLARHHAEAGPVIEFFRSRGKLIEHKVHKGVADMGALSIRIQGYLATVAGPRTADGPCGPGGHVGGAASSCL
mmetsp:Transcript_57865/g.130469  ORF Transcript_57865/g.130469 Transcript_57865/m.130469 type:complete len:283 (-) Transcript_57865:82-930(-)